MISPFFHATGDAAASPSAFARQAVCHTHRGASGTWPAGSQQPACWKLSTCNKSLIASLVAQHTEDASCSVALRADGCFSHRIPWRLEELRHLSTSEPDLLVEAYLKVACRRIVPRDGCACLPCFTECRRSALCPLDALGGTHVSQLPPAPIAAEGRFAYVTTVAFSSEFVALHGLKHWRSKYMLGALRLALSLRDVGAAFPLVVIAANLSTTYSLILERANLTLLPVPFVEQLKRFGNRRFAGTFSKLNLWSLAARFDRVVSLDCDMLVHRNIDHLFARAIRTPAAVAEPTASDFLGGPRNSMLPFNTGLLVVAPNLSFFESMLSRLPSLPSYDGSDQGFLNSAHRDASGYFELPRRYNLFGCVQEDEVEEAFVYHLNGAFHGASLHPAFVRFKAPLDARARTLYRLPCKHQACLNI